jgi:putative metalloprotease
MRFRLFVVPALSLLLAAGAVGCVRSGYVGAAGDLYAGATVTDAELVSVSKQMRAVGDKQNTVAAGKNKYAARLERLTGRFRNEDGLSLNFKAYITPEVNANATADGSIRVYTGLMDMMTDNELLFVIGHEIGHVKDGDSLDKIRMAYLSSAAIKAGAASVSGPVVLSTSQLGELLHVVINAQFSQKQEYDADQYGYNLLKKYNVDRQAAVSALQKLASLGGGGGITSSHPDSADRAKRIADKIADNG